MTLQETLSKLNWGGAGYSAYEGFGQVDFSDPSIIPVVDSSTGSAVDPSALAAAGGVPLGTSPGIDTNFAGNGVGSGSTSGVSGFDTGGFVNDLGSIVSSVLKQTVGSPQQQVVRLPNGQVMLPNGTIVGATPVFTQGSSNLLLIAAIVVVVVLLMRKSG